MEAAERIPEGGRLGHEIADLVSAEGPFLSVVLTTDPAVENASQRSELRWKSLRSKLASDGVPEAALEAVDPLVSARCPARRGQRARGGRRG